VAPQQAPARLTGIDLRESQKAPQRSLKEIGSHRRHCDEKQGHHHAQAALFHGLMRDAFHVDAEGLHSSHGNSAKCPQCSVECGGGDGNPRLAWRCAIESFHRVACKHFFYIESWGIRKAKDVR
jgi:hypothetical protein